MFNSSHLLHLLHYLNQKFFRRKYQTSNTTIIILKIKLMSEPLTCFSNKSRND